MWRFPPERDNPHPAPFPLVLPTRAICAALRDAKGVVIDPYCGSGTTLAAAKLLGCGYVGIDLSPEYVAMSESRLANCESERAELESELARHQVRANGSFQERKRAGMNVGKFAPMHNGGESGVLEFGAGAH